MYKCAKKNAAAVKQVEKKTQGVFLQQSASSEQKKIIHSNM
jgi:hypothetical protein